MNKSTDMLAEMQKKTITTLRSSTMNELTDKSLLCIEKQMMIDAAIDGILTAKQYLDAAGDRTAAIMVDSVHNALIARRAIQHKNRLLDN